MSHQGDVVVGEERGSATGGTVESPGDSRTPALQIQGLHKEFRRRDGTRVPALDGVSLSVTPGEFLVLLGPSGCGKTTLLRCIAGLETGDTGRVSIRGRPVFDTESRLDIPSEHRGINMIFQSYALWPHMTVAGNVGFPLRSRRVPKGDIQDRVQRALDLVGIGELTTQYPGQLSGGQQQRVALARALVTGDELVLFDEPLSNVDAKVRAQLRVDLLSMQREIGFAAVYVTHDQVEAMELANRIAVMRRGQIAQVGSPPEVYEEPATYYVADFIGAANAIEGVVTGRCDDGLVVDTTLGQVVAGSAPDNNEPGDSVAVVWRPEACATSATEPTHLANRWQAVVQAAMYVGTHAEHVLLVGETQVRIWRAQGHLMEVGSELWVGVDPSFVRALRRDDEQDDDAGAPA